MKWTRSLVALAALALAAPARARADDAPKPVISVTVRGHAAQSADAVEVEITVSSTGTEAVDAEKKYREKLGRILAALRGEKTSSKKRADRPPAKSEKPAKKGDDEGDDDEDAPKTKRAKPPKKDDADDDKPAKTEKPAPKDKDDARDEDQDDPALKVAIELREEGLTISPKVEEAEAPHVMIRRMMNGGGNEQPKEPTFRVASRVIAKIKEIGAIDKTLLRRRLAWVIDKALQNGASDDGGGPPRVHFLIADLEALKKRAYADAVEKAKSRAAEIAKLGGRAIARLSTVRENPIASDSGEAKEIFTASILGRTLAGEKLPTSIDIAQDVDLVVEFELAP